jgi:hypothetical protein
VLVRQSLLQLIRESLCSMFVLHRQFVKQDGRVFILIAERALLLCWEQGHPDQAEQLAHKAIKDAAAIDHPVTLSIVLNRAITLFVWIGDLAPPKNCSIVSSCTQNLIP